MKTKSKTIERGTTIHTEKPFVHILNTNLRTERCDNCFALTKLLKCSGCQYVYYCDRQCQKDSWSVHKSECANLRRIAPKIVPDAARLLARLVIKLRTGGDLVKGYYSPTEYRVFKNLMSRMLVIPSVQDYSDIKEDRNRMEHFMCLCAVLFEFLEQQFLPNSAELLGIYGRMCVNGFSILDAEMTGIGTGIYLGASIIDHSCKPNALAVFEGTTLFLRTLETVTINDISQVFICYIDLLNEPKERQKELEHSYYFLCKCNMCSNLNEMKLLNSGSCPKCKHCVQLDENVCLECGETLTDEFKTNFQNAVQFTQYHLKNMNDIAYFDACKICLKEQDGFLHPLNLLHVKILDLAFESSIQLSFWDEAEDFGIRLIPGYRQYYGNVHPLLGLLYVKLGKILLYKNKPGAALKYLKEAEIILKITHGESHTLYLDKFLPLMEQASAESVFNSY